MLLHAQEGLNPILHERQILQIQPTLSEKDHEILERYPNDPQLQRDSSEHYLEVEALRSFGKKNIELLSQLGNPVEKMLNNLGRALAKQISKNFPELEHATHLFIPRSGWALAYGFTSDESELLKTNQGALKQDGSILSLEQFHILSDRLLVIDDLLYQGKALQKLLEELEQRGYHGKVTMLCATADAYKAREIIMAHKMVERILTASAPIPGIASQIRS